MPRQVKVAVIGSGLAGLTAAYILSNSNHPESNVEFEVHIFEKAAILGMDSSSISVSNPDSKSTWRVDVPMRSFQGGYYPRLLALYKRLGVSFREADFSYSFSLFTPPSLKQDKQIHTTMIYNGSSGTGGLSIPSILGEPDHLANGKDLFGRFVARAWTWTIFTVFMVYITICYLRMLFFALPFWRPRDIAKVTFGEWAERTVPAGWLGKLTRMDVAWRDYTHTVLLPLFSALCTAPDDVVLRHPIEEFLDYIWLTLGTHHYVVTNGVCEVVEKLSSKTQHIHLSSSISSITPDPKNSQVAVIYCDTPSGPAVHPGFHHVIFATQAIQAVPLLLSFQNALRSNDPKQKMVEAQVSCLKSFEYRSTIVINHTDSTLLPNNDHDRRDLNLISMERDRVKEVKHDWNTGIVPPSYTMTTQVLQRPKTYPAYLPAVYQTTNPIVSPREESILSVARLERAVVTRESKEALEGLYKEKERKWWHCAGQGKCRLGELQGAGVFSNIEGPGLWICGSYVFAGIPLLEGCVASARMIVEKGVCAVEGVTATSSTW